MVFWICVSDGSGNPLVERSGTRDCSEQHDRVYDKSARFLAKFKTRARPKKSLLEEIPYQSEANHKVAVGVVWCGIEGVS